MKVVQQCLLTAFITKIPVFQGIDGNSKTVFQIFYIHTADKKGIVADDLGRCKLCDLI